MDQPKKECYWLVYRFDNEIIEDDVLEQIPLDAQIIMTYGSGHDTDRIIYRTSDSEDAYEYDNIDEPEPKPKKPSLIDRNPIIYRNTESCYSNELCIMHMFDKVVFTKHVSDAYKEYVLKNLEVLNRIRGHKNMVRAYAAYSDAHETEILPHLILLSSEERRRLFSIILEVHGKYARFLPYLSLRLEQEIAVDIVETSFFCISWHRNNDLLAHLIKRFPPGETLNGLITKVICQPDFSFIKEKFTYVKWHPSTLIYAASIMSKDDRRNLYLSQCETVCDLYDELMKNPEN